MLTANGLSYQRNKRTLFKQLTFQLCSGQALHIVGANGSGKTTLLQILTGLIPALSGSVMWHGNPIENQMAFKQELLYINHRLGMKTILTPTENLFLFLTRRNLINMKTKQKVVNNIQQVLERLNLNLYSNSVTGQLSVGQQRRLILAKLLLIKADCWILDEPFTALDKNGIALVSSLMDEQKHRGGLVIFTSHQTDYSFQSDVKLIFLDNNYD